MECSTSDNGGPSDREKNQWLWEKLDSTGRGETVWEKKLSKQRLCPTTPVKRDKKTPLLEDKNSQMTTTDMLHCAC